jgi:MATE family multidrug resistance protein
MQFADRGMLAAVGDLEAASAGTAGMLFFCFLGFGYGVLFVVNTLASQAYGRKDYAQAGPYMWQGIWFGLMFGIATMAMYPFAGALFAMMGHEPRMVGLEVAYFQVILLGGPLKLVTLAMGQCLLGLHRPMIVFVAAVCGVAVNLLLNWVLIYGNWGFPAMGVAGAAWGTNGAVLVELIVMGLYLARPGFFRVFNASDWRLRVGMMRTMLRIGIPAGFQLICDIAAWTIFLNWIVASYGTAALAANSFAFTYMHVCFMPAIGVGSAVTALVGKYIGAGRPDVSARRAHLGFAVCAVYMVAAGVTLAVFREPLMGFFTDDPETRRLGGIMLLFVAAYQIFDAMFLVYVGALRGAGDTLVPAAVQAALVWSIVVVGGGVLAWQAPHWGVAGPWTLATIFAALLGVFLLIRFLKGGWKHIRLEEPSGESKLPGFDLAPEAA